MTPDDAWRPRYDAAAGLAAALFAALPAPTNAHRAGTPKPGLLVAAWARDDKTVLLAIDAVGHGGPAAGLLALAVAHVLAAETDPGPALTRANGFLLSLARSDPPFVAAGMAVRDGDHVLTARAGIPPLLHCGEEIEIWPDPGPPLGLLENVYATQTRAVPPRARILLAAGDPGDNWISGAERHRGCGVRHLAERIHADLIIGRRADDVVLLAAEV